MNDWTIVNRKPVLSKVERIVNHQSVPGGSLKAAGFGDGFAPAQTDSFPIR